MSPVRRVAAAAGAAALIVGSCLLPGGRAAADSTYSATTEAGGLRLLMSNESIPLGIQPEVSGPLAVATQNSIQQSDALASVPYPGDAGQSLPSTVAGSTGAPVPAYPFIVTTSLGDAPARMSYPGIDLRAESAQTLTQASATFGGDAIGSTSTARVLRDGDVVTATGVTDADAIRLGEDLVISGLHATATAVRDEAGHLTRTSQLAFTSLSARGLTLTLPPPPGTNGPSTTFTPPAISLVDGKFRVLAPGQPQSDTEVPAADLVAALTKAGYPTTYEQAQQTANGIIGAGLRINTTLPSPPPGTPGGFTGETPVTLALGQVKAEISYQGAATQPSIGTGLPAGSAPTSTAATTPAITTPTTPGLLPPGTPGTPLANYGTAPATTGTALAPRPAVPTVDFTTLAANASSTDQPDVGWIYSLVAAVGVSALAGTVVLAYRGAR
ncbi:MAG TPA: hypothetical protein VGL04_08035 [Sporichthyaceae bacterium]|jgi:hypothetical protein